MVRTMMRRKDEHVHPVHWEEERHHHQSRQQPRRHDYHPHDYNRDDDELPRGRYYRPTLHRERTPSPPREYIYGTRRQREWHDGFPAAAADRHPAGEEENFGYEQSYPEQHNGYDAYDDSPHYDDHRVNGPGRPPLRSGSGGGGSRDRQMEERILQIEEEEEAYQRYRREEQERYRRFEEEELRRYEEEKNRKENERLLVNEAEEAEAQEKKNKRVNTRTAAAAAAAAAVESMSCPYGIPKPPSPHPGFEASHNPSNWSIQMQENDEKSVKIDSNRSVGSKNSVLVIGGNSHHSSSSKSISSKIYYSSSHSQQKFPPAACKSDGLYQYERKELPDALRRTSKSRRSSSCEDSSHRYQRKEVLPPAALKRDSSSSRCHSGIIAAYKSHGAQDDGFSLKKDSMSSGGSRHQQKKQAATAAPAKMQVEIQPGFSLPLKGSQETLEAVAIGRVLHTPCLACCGWIVVRDDCDFVICPECRVVSPVEGGYGTMEYVGLGMTQSAHDATVARLCHSCKF